LATAAVHDRERRSEAGWSALPAARFAFVLLQLAVLLVVCWQFDVQNRSFQQILGGALVAFLVHAALPMRWRPPFFLVCSLGAFAFVLGLVNVGALLAVGAVLIGLCHLPLSWSARVALLCAAGGVLALLRAGILPGPVSSALWPVLGSVFMFRLAVYLYDTSRERDEIPLARRLSYFFMLPNPVFPLFPIVDYQTFQRSYYADDPHAIYQRGVQWMTRGVVHLLLYRVVYQHCMLSPEDVLDVADLAQYLLSTFLLYLQISGQFHLIVGLLHLFGFKLPETNHHYFLASSVTDFWRRINIYWKDFMMKTVYWPTVLRLRRRIGQRSAVVASTGLVFLVSWALHSYQWFWLRDTFPVQATDVIFWGGLGVLAVINAAWEAKPRSAVRFPLLRGRVGLLLRTVATFTVICLLWSVWSAEDLAHWRALWILPESFEPADLTWTQILLFVGVAALLASSVVLGGDASRKRRRESGSNAAADGSFWALGARACAALLPLLLLGTGWLQSALGRGGEFVAHLRQSRLNQVDQQEIIRGYYEELVHVEQFNTALFTGLERRPVFSHFFGGEKGADRKTDDLLGHELRPSVSVPWKLKSFSTNRWGMRDREYDLEKREGTYRVAWLGSSHLMGWGVADDETFENRIEERLNAAAPNGNGVRVEFLNFGVSDYSILHNVFVLEERALRFQPDAVVYVAHRRDAGGGGERALAGALNRGVDVPYPFLAELAARAGVAPGMPVALGRKRLAPYRDEILAWAYARFAQAARARGIVPIWTFLPERADAPDRVPPVLLRTAREAGFEVLDVGDPFEGHREQDLNVAAWDFHPNAEAHEILADRLHAALTRPGAPLEVALRGHGAGRDVARQAGGLPHVGAGPPGGGASAGERPAAR